jgi:hypothetical protein
MSRKHYKAIAEAIREGFNTKELREEVAKALLEALKSDNSRFDSRRFIKAAIGE